MAGPCVDDKLLHPCGTANQSTRRVYTLKPENVPHHLSRLRPAVECWLKEGYHEGRKIKQTEHWPSALPRPPSLPLSFLLPSSHHILVTLWLSKRKISEIMYSSPQALKS